MNVPENATYAYIGAVVDELVRSGVTDLCLCPGSRSTPIAVCAARHPGIRVWTLIDERSAGFFALGLAKGLSRPAALLSTSGTAAANFLPAVIEARYGRVPLVVLTADRPHELRDTGALQTIDQVRLYGTHAKWFADVAIPEATDALMRYARSVASRAVAVAAGAPPGPVHLNFPLREPLVPVPAPEQLPPEEARAHAAWTGRDEGRPYVASQVRRAPDPELASALARELTQRRRGLIVCGPLDDPALPDAVCRLAAALGYPVLADPLSQVRCGPHDRGPVIDGYDALLRIRGANETLAPEVVLRFGAAPASKPLLRYLEVHGAVRQIVVDAGGEWNDPARLAAEFVHADPAPLCQAVLGALAATGAVSSAPGAVPSVPGVVSSARGAHDWLALWQRLGAQSRDAIRIRLDAMAEPFEGKVFAELAGLLPDGAVLYVGNSMPVRDLDTFSPGTPRSVRFLGNRGASGIDGLVSSALGVAAGMGARVGGGRPTGSTRAPVVLVLGDLAFYHDLNGLLAAKLYGLNATIVLINNDGGGIFSFLPQAGYPEYFEALFGTPHGLDFRHAAGLYGARHALVESWEEFRAHVREGISGEGLSIVEVRTARDRNVLLHREVWQTVESALRAWLPPGAAGGPS
ncbi:MAG: 2-succinyl-5-enolpyruvyl-6-hydroxy-3-cyclohexene-1-carboxylic-acid synthase [Armatimonadetes bacterium]|nr:2-succinyl-5-enolpyruvyl-6-hydroxy-3-cyclohexene-1-carboxylic-acid synthase [Armatimonadota bacterium]